LPQRICRRSQDHSQVFLLVKMSGGVQNSLTYKTVGACEGIEAMELGKLLVFLGAVLVVAGIVLMLLGRMNSPLGRLPGDFLYRGKNTTVYFPLASSLVVSVVLSIVLYWVSRWRR